MQPRMISSWRFSNLRPLSARIRGLPFYTQKSMLSEKTFAIVKSWPLKSPWRTFCFPALWLALPAEQLIFPALRLDLLALQLVLPVLRLVFCASGVLCSIDKIAKTQFRLVERRLWRWGARGYYLSSNTHSPNGGEWFISLRVFCLACVIGKCFSTLI